MAFLKKPGSLGQQQNSGGKKPPPFLGSRKKETQKTEEAASRDGRKDVSTTSLTGSTSKRCVLRMRPRMGKIDPLIFGEGDGGTF